MRHPVYRKLGKGVLSHSPPAATAWVCSGAGCQAFSCCQRLDGFIPRLVVLLVVVAGVQIGIKIQNIGPQLRRHLRKFFLTLVLQQLGIGNIGQRIFSSRGFAPGVTIGIGEIVIAFPHLMEQRK